MATVQEMLQSILAELKSLSERVGTLESNVARSEGGQQKITSTSIFAAEPPRPPVTQPVSATGQRTQTAAEHKTFETEVGIRWLGKIGIVAIAIGVAYLLQYTIEKSLFGITVGPVGRIVLGFIIGIVMLSFGEFFHSRYPQWSKEFTGGGLGILYFAIFTASNLEGAGQASAVYNCYSEACRGAYSGYTPFIPYWFGLVLMSFVTAAAGWFSIRYNAKVIAFFGLLGGYLTPLMIGYHSPDYHRMMIYLLILNLGVFVFANFRQWRILNALALIITTFYSFSAYPHMGFGAASGYLFIFFILFLSVAVQYNLLNRKETKQEDLFLLLANPFITIGHLYFLFQRFHYDNYLGLLSIGFAVLYLILSYSALMVNKNDKYLALTFIGLTAGFVAMAIPLQFRTYEHWTTIGWAVQFLAMLWIGLQLRMEGTRMYALIVGVFMLIRVFVVDISGTYSKYQTAFFNPRVYTTVFAIAAVYVGAYMYKYYRRELQTEERKLASVLVIIANCVTLYLLSTEISGYYAQKVRALYSVPQPTTSQYDSYGNNRAGYQPPVYDYNAIDSLRQTSHIVVSFFWLVYATALILIGIAKKYRSIRLLALALFALSILKIVIYDLTGFEAIYRIIAFIVLGIFLIFASFMYTKNKERVLEFILDKKNEPDTTATVESMSDEGKTNVVFTLADGRRFKVANPNIVKMSLSAQKQFGKSTFEKNELLETYEYYEKNFRSKLNQKDLAELKKYLYEFVITGGSFEIS